MVFDELVCQVFDGVAEDLKSMTGLRRDRSASRLAKGYRHDGGRRGSGIGRARLAKQRDRSEGVNGTSDGVDCEHDSILTLTIVGG